MKATNRVKDPDRATSIPVGMKVEGTVANILYPDGTTVELRYTPEQGLELATRILFDIPIGRLELALQENPDTPRKLKFIANLYRSKDDSLNAKIARGEIPGVRDGKVYP